MILDKELYESRGYIKGFFLFLLRIILPKSQLTRLRPRHSLVTYPSLIVDQQGQELCRSCHQCEELCPTQAIKVKGNKGHLPDEFQLDLLRCSSCGECVKVCPSQALLMSDRKLLAIHGEARHELNKKELLIQLERD